MDNITSKETMEEFIGKIIDGKGNFFKPLSKSDLYKLATRIRELEAEVRRLGEIQGGGEPATDEDSPAECVSDAETTGCAEDTGEESSADAEENGAEFPSCADAPVRTWRDVLEQRGADAQDAFDEFVKWREKHPKQSSVMDFTTGMKSVGAAFAYWLTSRFQEG